jgi:hypothetical protein
LNAEMIALLPAIAKGAALAAPFAKFDVAAA